MISMLVMTNAQANSYEAGSNVISLSPTVLMQHLSLGRTVPEGRQLQHRFRQHRRTFRGAGDGSDVQVEIGVTSLTSPSLGNLWTGWHQCAIIHWRGTWPWILAH